MKKVIMGAAAAAVGLTMISAAQAEELYDPHLEGVGIGMAAGALPPKGVYFVNDSYFLNYKRSNDNATGAAVPTGAKLSGYVDVPILLWNPGIKILGADYAAAVAQPFDYAGVALGGTAVDQNHWGTYNTLVIPAILSWTLGDFHVAPSIGVYLDDASSSMHSGSTPAYGVPTGMANTTFEPGLGLSWLHDGWNASIQLYYDTSTADSNSAATGGKYQSGDQFGTELSIVKSIGKWEVGLGGFTLNQLQSDTNNGATLANTQAERIGLGPIVGYTFGGLILQAQFMHDVVTKNDFGGDFLNVRAIVPLF